MATHITMPKKLAQALIEAGMQHHDLGGIINGIGSVTSPLLFGGQKGMPGVSGLVGDTGFTGLLGPASGVLGIQGTPGVSGFTANDPSIQTQDFSQRIPQLQQQQDALAKQLLAQTQGQGPGQQLIAEQAGKNAAQQSALMASARGANANPALIARQAAMANAGANQQALNAQAALQLQSQQALGNLSLQGESIAQGAQAAQNSALTQGSLGAQNINANTQMANAGQRGGILGGVLGGAASGIIGGLFSKGGEVPKMADGGAVPLMGIEQFQTPGVGIPELNKPQAYQPMGGGLGAGLGKGLMSLFGGGAGAGVGGAVGGGLGADIGMGGAGAGAGEGLGAIFGAGAGSEAMLPAVEYAGDAAMLAAHGGKIPFGQMLAGGNVPGKAEVKGDSERNDKVPTLLSPGEVVLPRSVTQGGNVEAKAVEFLRHLKKSKGRGYKAVAEARKAE